MPPVEILAPATYQGLVAIKEVQQRQLDGAVALRFYWESTQFTNPNDRIVLDIKVRDSRNGTPRDFLAWVSAGGAIDKEGKPLTTDGVWTTLQPVERGTRWYTGAIRAARRVVDAQGLPVLDANGAELFVDQAITFGFYALIVQ